MREMAKLLKFCGGSGRRHRRACHLPAWVTMGALALLSACAPQRPPLVEPPRSTAHLVPSDLKVRYLKKGIVLSWVTNRRPGDVISGYNIYVSPEQSLLGNSPDSLEMQGHLWKGITYPGDTNPRTDVEEVEMENLEFGIKYYIHVRTVLADGTINGQSEEIEVIPRPTGRLRLVPRFRGEGEGYSFADQEYVSSRDPRNDLYLFVRNDSVFAASPHRLDRNLRYTEFHRAGPSTSIDEYPKWEISRKGSTSILLEEGVTYILSTPETCLAKFRVVQIEGKEADTAVTVDYVYQPRCGSGVF
jgi:hypothetical protein